VVEGEFETSAASDREAQRDVAADSQRMSCIGTYDNLRGFRRSPLRDGRHANIQHKTRPHGTSSARVSIRLSRCENSCDMAGRERDAYMRSARAQIFHVFSPTQALI
jgi:hypothetical protein